MNFATNLFLFFTGLALISVGAVLVFLIPNTVPALLGGAGLASLFGGGILLCDFALIQMSDPKRSL